ncbi:response regulator [Candidatus Symbiobacter mobilis]|uniref:Twitching motility two-component system response regulator PilH n=1 Tax=Candidatus Symbiobacter mobilis CR TaxID=946483 RepID=U5NAI9_9BURK|nr:response regulator [Candidatus Symbiobacter mobilis]AGX87214.1 twitching motility two-component system response regulator PilH [Candidatus Symbiobacter mobilis CR]
MTIRKVLVIDDSKTDSLFLSDILLRHGMTVHIAENAEEAMRCMENDKPDLILMDVVMPGQNGFQLTRSLCRNPQYAGIPIILCTSKSLETDRVWGLRQGARDYIVKPINAEELLTKIQAVASARTA